MLTLTRAGEHSKPAYDRRPKLREQLHLRDSSDAPETPQHAERAAPGDALLGRALALVRFLRERCAWDARQDPRTLRPYLLEEAHEVADAIAAGDDEALAGELGDLLLNLAFQVVLAEEREAFDAAEVVARLETKMADRHPHIYGDAEEPADWEELKARQRDGDPFAGVPSGLEPLARALRLQERAAAHGFDWTDASGPLRKVREEAGELAALLELEAADGTGDTAAPDGADASGGRDPAARVALEEELGDLLFAAVNLGRWLDVHPSTALLGALEKFQRRVREVWRRAAEAGVDPGEASLETLDGIWEEVKGDEGSREGPRPPDSGS